MIDPNMKVSVGDRIRYACNPDLVIGTVLEITNDPFEPFTVRWDGSPFDPDLGEDGEHIGTYARESLVLH